MHPWIGAGPGDRQRVLAELGCENIDELFASLPAEVCIDHLDLAAARDESSIISYLAGAAGANITISCQPCFLGAGVYRHLQPSLVDAVLNRAELFTSYTPYQPEISQGTLQAIFEFQTFICQLTGLGVANASMYDGATALVEATLLAHRALRGKRNRIVVAETVHPIYRQVLDTYCRALDIEVVAVSPGSDGRTSAEALREVAAEACCVAVQSPSFVGVIEDLPAVAEAAHGAGALAVQVVNETVSLGLLEGGGSFGFDVVCGDAQSFGIAPGLGGPHLGFLACQDKYMRQMPGRLVGATVDSDGQPAYCLTLATREQHIRRAKATSNICTNHGLMALAATVWLAAIGGSGLREMAGSCLSRSEELKRRLQTLGEPWHLAYADSPTFNELLLVGPAGGEELVEKLAAMGVLAGAPARKWGGSWPDGILVAVTELCSAQDIEALISALGRLS